jgi:phosphate transport system substrate-binding protein
MLNTTLRARLYSRRLFIRTVLLTAPVMAACNRVETPRVTPIPVRVRIAADGATMPLMRALAQAYQLKKPEVEFSFELGVAQAVYDLSKSGNADIGTSAELPADPADMPWFTDLALDGVAVIVNASNPIAELSLAQLREIVAGFRNEWAYFGAQDAGSIQVVVREAGEATRRVFDRVVMGDIAPTSSAVVMPTDDTAQNYVALNLGAIAYVPGGRVSVSAPPSIKLLVIEGNALRAETLAANRYPLFRNTYLFAKAEPQGFIREFVLWTRSPDAGQLSRSLGYSPP